MKVLIVDDSALVRGAVRRLFETDDVFEVCGEAANGREAVDQTTLLRPELIVMDLAMPLLNGLDATRAIKRLKPGVPVILFSGFSNVMEEKEARSAGISALVPKSDPSRLIDVAHQLRTNSSLFHDPTP